MRSSLSVRFWGVRGSLATGGPDFANIGGNTTCVEVRAGDEVIIFDAGTGVFPLGRTLPAPVRATFLFSHFHWDHIQGFPFFGPAYQPDTALTIYAPGESGAEVETVFREQMRAPNFPVPIETLRAALDFRGVRAGDRFEVGAADVRTAALNHPQGCLGYRITLGGASVAFATDTEALDGAEVDPTVVELARGADVLIHDCQYTEDEYHGRAGAAKRGWGHSTIEMACRAATLAGVRQLVLFHHDPSHDDRFMDRMADRASELFPDVIVAREGLTLAVDRVHAAHVAIPAASPPRTVEARSRHAA